MQKRSRRRRKTYGKMFMKDSIEFASNINWKNLKNKNEIVSLSVGRTRCRVHHFSTFRLILKNFFLFGFPPFSLVEIIWECAHSSLHIHYFGYLFSLFFFVFFTSHSINQNPNMWDDDGLGEVNEIEKFLSLNRHLFTIRNNVCIWIDISYLTQKCARVRNLTAIC